MAIEYFNAYHSILEAMEPLNDAERGRLFTALLIYSKTGATEKLSGNERFVFPGLRSQIDRDVESYNKKCQKQAENGKKGGRPPKPNESQKTHGFLEKPKEPKKAKEKEKEKEKTKAKEKDNSSFGAEVTAVISLPLNDGTEFPVTDVMLSEYSALYPAVDVMQELRNMRGWLLNNPKNRKTLAGIRRFINGWLAREQDKPRSTVTRPQNQYTHGADRLAQMLERGDFDD